VDQADLWQFFRIVDEHQISLGDNHSPHGNVPAILEEGNDWPVRNPVSPMCYFSVLDAVPTVPCHGWTYPGRVTPDGLNMINWMQNAYRHKDADYPQKPEGPNREALREAFQDMRKPQHRPTKEEYLKWPLPVRIKQNVPRITARRPAPPGPATNEIPGFATIPNAPPPAPGTVYPPPQRATNTGVGTRMATAPYGGRAPSPQRAQSRSRSPSKYRDTPGNNYRARSPPPPRYDPYDRPPRNQSPPPRRLNPTPPRRPHSPPPRQGDNLQTINAQHLRNQGRVNQGGNMEEANYHGDYHRGDNYDDRLYQGQVREPWEYERDRGYPKRERQNYPQDDYHDRAPRNNYFDDNRY
jgi:hypothetical protein